MTVIESPVTTDSVPSPFAAGGGPRAMLPTKVFSLGVGSGRSVTVSGVVSVVETIVTVWLVFPIRLSSFTVIVTMSSQM